ncbi:MAG: peptide deformylase [Firmicutes bacterium]|nr:peptide deformylase [Bacillota bacterium]
MGIRKLIFEGDPQLNKVSREVTEITDRIRILLDDLVDTMHEEGGVGLAAPQVGVLRRVCVVEVDEGEVYEFINPVIVEQEGDQYGSEGCLSVPGYYGDVHRPQRVVVEALDRNGKKQRYEAEDFKARAFCHEIDHLDGIVYTSKADHLRKVEEDCEKEKK